MNWLDISFLAVVILFLVAGARLGSVWVSACMGAGFLGMMLMDMYAVPLSDRFGSAAWAIWAARGALYVAALAAVLIPGWLLSRLTSVIMLGLIDGLFGFFAGAVAVVLFVILASMLIVPTFPSVEKKAVWQKSKLVRPLQTFLENKIERSR